MSRRPDSTAMRLKTAAVCSSRRVIAGQTDDGGRQVRLFDGASGRVDAVAGLRESGGDSTADASAGTGHERDFDYVFRSYAFHLK